MSETQAAAAAGAETTTQEAGLLDQILNQGFSPQTEKSRAQDLIGALVDEALKGTVTYDRNVTKTLRAHVDALDAALSKQLAAIMHHPSFQKLEGSWRGLHYLVMNSETSAQLKLRVLNVTKKDLFKDLDKAIEFDQSE